MTNFAEQFGMTSEDAASKLGYDRIEWDAAEGCWVGYRGEGGESLLVAATDSELLASLEY